MDTSKMNGLEDIESLDFLFRSMEEWNWDGSAQEVTPQPHQQNVQNAESEVTFQDILSTTTPKEGSVSLDFTYADGSLQLNPPERVGTPKPAGTPPSLPRDTKKRAYMQVSEVDPNDKSINHPISSQSPKKTRVPKRQCSSDMLVDSSPPLQQTEFGLKSSFGDGFSQDILSSGTMNQAINPSGVSTFDIVFSSLQQPQMSNSSQISPIIGTPSSSPRSPPSAAKRRSPITVTSSIPTPIQRQNSIQYAATLPDINALKVSTTELASPISRRDVRGYSNSCLEHLASQLGMHNGAVFLPSTGAQTWSCVSSYPSLKEFETYFQYEVGERFIIQAAAERRCFGVHSNSLETKNDQLSFLFVPISNDTNTGSAIAVYVLGAVLNREEELHQRLYILDHVRKSISQNMVAIMAHHNNLLLLQRFDFIRYENEALRQRGLIERALLGMLSSSVGLGNDTALICTNIKGVITYFSNSAESLLGYSSVEILHDFNLAQLHDSAELYERAAELSREFNRQIQPDFSAIVAKLLLSHSGEDCRTWTWTLRDKSAIRVSVNIKSLIGEDRTVYGFVVIARKLTQSNFI